MHLSEARADLYEKVLAWAHREEQDMSRLHREKGYYQAGETERLEAVSWSTAQHGYLQRVEVTYKLADGQLRTLHEDVVGYPGQVEETLTAMLARTSITHPD